MSTDVNEIPVGDDQPLDEVTRRFLIWARMRTEAGTASPRRDRAWNAYVDARDGLPDGTTQERAIANAHRDQLALFRVQPSTRKGWL